MAGCVRPPAAAPAAGAGAAGAAATGAGGLSAAAATATPAAASAPAPGCPSAPPVAAAAAAAAAEAGSTAPCSSRTFDRTSAMVRCIRAGSTGGGSRRARCAPAACHAAHGLPADRQLPTPCCCFSQFAACAWQETPSHASPSCRLPQGQSGCATHPNRPTRRPSSPAGSRGRCISTARHGGPWRQRGSGSGHAGSRLAAGPAASCPAHAACMARLKAGIALPAASPHRTVVSVRHHASQLLLLLCAPLPLSVHRHVVDICHGQLLLLACRAAGRGLATGWGRQRSVRFGCRAVAQPNPPCRMAQRASVPAQ